jgi:hypothetical protein
MPIAFFVDGYFAWNCMNRGRIDYIKLREFIEKELDDQIDEAYYFGAAVGSEPLQKLYKWLSLPPPTGPGFRVKEYWTTQNELRWPEKLGGGLVIHPRTGDHYVQMQQKAV